MKSERAQAPGRLTRALINDLLKKARALREKAEQLEKESDRLEAMAARELAKYLEGTAEDAGR